MYNAAASFCKHDEANNVLNAPTLRACCVKIEILRLSEICYARMVAAILVLSGRAPGTRQPTGLRQPLP